MLWWDEIRAYAKPLVDTLRCCSHFSVAFPCSRVSFSFSLGSSSLPACFGFQFSHAAEGLLLQLFQRRMAPHMHNVYLLIQLTLEQHGFELRGYTYRQLFFSKYSIEVGWLLRCRTWDMEGWLWDLRVHRFGYPWWVLEPVLCDTTGWLYSPKPRRKILNTLHHSPPSSFLMNLSFRAQMSYMFYRGLPTNSGMPLLPALCSLHLLTYLPFLWSPAGVFVMWIKCQLFEDRSWVTH